MTEHARHLPAQLSGGERQRVAIARVLAARPEILFADEPTASLDLTAAGKVLDWFTQISAAGTTLLMVTHDPQAAARADSVLVMDAGRIVAHVPGGSAQAVSQAILQARGHAAGAPGSPARPDGPDQHRSPARSDGPAQHRSPARHREPVVAPVAGRRAEA